MPSINDNAKPCPSCKVPHNYPHKDGCAGGQHRLISDAEYTLLLIHMAWEEERDARSIYAPRVRAALRVAGGKALMTLPKESGDGGWASR